METPTGLTGHLLDGRYRVGAVIARGGMSVVYRGVDTRLDRPVAVKVMNPQLGSDPSFASRFEREARLAAALSHPGVVAVYDQGRDGDHAFLVMELVDGGTLRDLLRGGRALSVPATVAVLDGLLAALGAAHAAGLVHRDVKPENVLISAAGRVKVADFGLVRAVSSQTMATGDVILGTVAYLSPEQVARGTADARSDVYSAGIVAYEMLTGAPPFTGDTPLSVAYQHVNADVPRVSERAPDVPLGLDELLLDATSRDPRMRPRDAGAFRSAVCSVRDGVGIPQVPVPVPVRHDNEPRVPAERGHGVRPRADPAQAVPAQDVPAQVGPAQVGPAQVGPAGDQAPVTAVVPGPPAAGPHGTALAPDGRPATLTGLPAAPPAQPPARRRWWPRLLVVLLLLVIAAAAAIGGWWLGSGRFTLVPGANGMTQQAAEQSLRRAGLVPLVAPAYDDTVPAGRVSAVDPAAGSRQLRGTQVRLTVSTGRPRVPQIEPGTDLRTATARLAAATLVASVDPTPVYDAAPTGTVVRTSPDPGDAVDIGSTVLLITSRGPAPVTVPGVAGKAPDDARNALLAAGFTVGPPVRRFDAEHVAGTVLGTDPAGGAQAPRGSAVALVLADSLTVPDVTGQDPTSARDTLQQAGFTVVDGDPEFDPDVVSGQVSRTDPAAGTRVDPARPTVTLITSDAVAVPDLRGHSVGDARDELTALGLSLQVYALVGTDGARIIDQNPDPGSLVAPGSTVTVTAFP